MRKHQLTFPVLGALHVNLYLFAYGQFGVVAEFGDRNDTFRLVADVHDHLAFGDAYDGTFYHFAHLYVGERLVVLLLYLLFASAVEVEVVFEDVPVELFVGYFRLGGSVFNGCALDYFVFFHVRLKCLAIKRLDFICRFPSRE